MKNLNSFVAGFAAVSIAAACEPPKPPENVVPVTVVEIPSVTSSLPSSPAVPLEKPDAAHEKISEEVKDAIQAQCYMEEPHHQCEKNELESFFTLTYQLHPNLRKACMTNAGYDMPCMEKTFEGVFQGQFEYDRFITIKANCRYLLERCVLGKLKNAE